MGSEKHSQHRLPATSRSGPRELLCPYTALLLNEHYDQILRPGYPWILGPAGQEQAASLGLPAPWLAV